MTYPAYFDEDGDLEWDSADISRIGFQLQLVVFP